MEYNLDDMLAAERARTAAMTRDERREKLEAQSRVLVLTEAAFGSDAEDEEFHAALVSGDPERIAACEAAQAKRVAAAMRAAQTAPQTAPEL